MGIPMLKIRRSWDRLIFNMVIPILVRRHLYIEMALGWLLHFKVTFAVFSTQLSLTISQFSGKFSQPQLLMTAKWINDSMVSQGCLGTWLEWDVSLIAGVVMWMQWSRDKMATSLLRTTFSNAFCERKLVNCKWNFIEICPLGFS